MIYMCKINIL